MGQIATFYSFKGGVGRTMALANVAVLLAKWGKRVLIVDWDLEAPGVEHFFRPFIDVREVSQQQGLIDVLASASGAGASAISATTLELPIRIPLPECKGSLGLITAGKRDADYFKRVRDLDIKALYSKKNGAELIESLRNDWIQNYDFVLVDSRTGITDIGGICTIQLPDMLVLFLTTTEQSLSGILDVARKATEEHRKLPYDRLALCSVPIPNKFDTLSEHLEAQRWLDRFAVDLKPLYDGWLPKDVDKRVFLEMTKIPYVSYFSFGEKLPVLEPGTVDPSGLGYAYETLASLVANELNHVDVLATNRAEFLQLALRPKVDVGRSLDSPGESTVLFIDPAQSKLIGSYLSRETAREDVVSQAEVPTVFRKLVDDAIESAGGAIVSSEESAFLIVFPSSQRALECGLRVQQQLAVQPIRTPTGPFKVRMGLHCTPKLERSENTVAAARIAALITTSAREGQFLVSEAVRDANANSPQHVRFRRAVQIEIDGESRSPQLLQLFEAVGIRRIKLEPKEVELLTQRVNRTAGGFQAFVASLQDNISRQSTLDLTISDQEKIARYAFDYRSGGYQGRLLKIFGRSLGDRLGR